jgi:hypothetical protein
MPTARIVLALTLLASTASADAETSRARDAYDRGVHAHATGDFETAAKAFAEADALSPTAASLEAALEDAMKADDVALGAELLDRAAHRADRDAALTRTIDAAKKRFAGRTGTIRVDCTECLVAVDGRATATSVFVATGPHTVVVQRGDDRVERLVEVKPGVTARVAGPPMAHAETPSRTEEKGISPIWFFVAAGVTAVAGGVSIWSGIDANHQHDRFVSAGCAPGATGPKSSTCAGRADDGSGATTRSNVLIASTAVFAVATAALGTFVVRWKF